MALNIWNLEFLNHNSQRSYPIADWATQSCKDAKNIKLPKDFILALSLAVSCGADVKIEYFYIKSIVVVSTGAIITIGYFNNSDNPDVASSFIPFDQDQTTFALTGLGDFADIIGYIAVDTKSPTMKQLSGMFNFDYADTALEPDCVRPMIHALSSLTVENQGAVSDKLYGDITLRAGSNMDISVSGNTVTFSAINSNGFENDCVCNENSDKIPITSINGISAGGSGNITIVGTDCMQVNTNNSAVTLEDTCAEPCCGCTELNSLYDNYRSILDGSKTLENFVNELNAKVDQISIIYAGGSNGNSCHCITTNTPVLEPGVTTDV